MMKRRIESGVLTTALWAAAVLCLSFGKAIAQVAPFSPPESRFVHIDGARLHYLDFGGEGVPILFTAGSRAADTWVEFAGRFSDQHRVIALTDRGISPSEGDIGGYVRRSHDILALLDSLGIDRAILVANSNPGSILVYIAEHHPDRVAGLVFLAPDSEAGLESVTDPSRAMQMVERALLSVQGGDPDQAGRWDEEDLYRPLYLSAHGPTISIPALTFVNRHGTRGLERSYYPLQVAQMVAAGGLAIPDSVSRTYFERLASEPDLQREVRASWDSIFATAITANEQAFFRAFGEHLRVVRLEVPDMGGGPVVTGYEYRDAPDLIEGEIQSFLAKVRARESLR